MFNDLKEMRALTSRDPALRLAMLAGERKRTARMANIMQRGKNQLAVQRLANQGSLQRANIQSATQREISAGNALARLQGIEEENKGRLEYGKLMGENQKALEQLRGQNILTAQQERDKAAMARLTAQGDMAGKQTTRQALIGLANRALQSGAIDKNTYARLLAGGDEFNAPDLTGVDLESMANAGNQIEKGRFVYIKPTTGINNKVIQPGFILDTATGKPVPADNIIGALAGQGENLPPQQSQQAALSETGAEGQEPTEVDSAIYKGLVNVVQSLPDDKSRKAYLLQIKEKAPALYYQLLSDLQNRQSNEQPNPLLNAL